MSRIGLAEHLLTFCIHAETKQILAAAGITSTVVISDAQEATGMDQFQTKQDLGFAGVTTMKLRVVHAVVGLGYNVLFTDGDVFWNKNPLPYLLVIHNTTVFTCFRITRLVIRQDHLAQSGDALFMCDSTHTKEEKDRLINSGFFVMRPSPKILQLVDPGRVRTIVEHSSSEGGRILHDQVPNCCCTLTIGLNYD